MSERPLLRVRAVVVALVLQHESRRPVDEVALAQVPAAGIEETQVHRGLREPGEDEEHPKQRLPR
jgi:hypothetical protein